MTQKPKLPPLPWSYYENPWGFVYIVDINNRKIATTWGTADEKIATAELLCDAAKEVA
jgi:hypothetical protein